jgi:hypothetical protein
LKKAPFKAEIILFLDLVNRNPLENKGMGAKRKKKSHSPHSPLHKEERGHKPKTRQLCQVSPILMLKLS